MTYDKDKEFSNLLSVCGEILPKGSKVLFLGDLHQENLSLAFKQGLHVEMLSNDLNSLLLEQEKANKEGIFIITRHANIENWHSTKLYDAVVIGWMKDLSINEKELLEKVYNLLGKNGFLLGDFFTTDPKRINEFNSLLLERDFIVQKMLQSCTKIEHESSSEEFVINYLAQKR